MNGNTITTGLSHYDSEYVRLEAKQMATRYAALDPGQA